MNDFSAIYADLERRITRLVAELQPQLTDQEVALMGELLEAREYGLALEDLAGLLVEESKNLALPVLQEITSIAHAMGIQDAAPLGHLHEYYRRHYTAP